ncbi:hypothetical protein B6N60_01697 [Richelia sinica FACHB-800]|uniref:Cytochrome b561 bacterial/Ni-hydrogenase domain-containing protein n=1 Tax=Richelia sinica FACHB-800 TaxID=1357546 RepID=A0A975Y4B4_9NOST|nr:cytochrome b/b6 domain-containing protein [Richelia sinica]MBD2667407.1 cytochrome b/b6 domain-containing protein [Richelia sinica FACHB-800]QXE23009.1 hypothetical protein B6N60_01697 [Richelia sinica FACHB-800]
MARSAPYQPLLLRILHGVSGILAVGAFFTGFLVYNTFDGRFGKLPIPKFDPIQDLHGTLALCFLLLFPALAIYSFHAGKKRLIQPDSFQQLTQLGRPIWWVSLQRLANTLMLVASIFALVSGRMMKEEWLPTGELDHIWYYFHLLAWLVIGFCLAIHILMSAKVGGAPLLLSMFSWRFIPEDSPMVWYSRLQAWLINWNQNFPELISQWKNRYLFIKIVEGFVIFGVVAAFLLPVFFAAD